jgi:hypothetical protein
MVIKMVDRVSRIIVVMRLRIGIWERPPIHGYRLDMI